MKLSTARLPSLAEIRAERDRRKADAERRALEQNADRIRADCLSLAGFVRAAWHVLEPSTTLVWGWHLDAICAHLEAVTDGRLKRLLINVPPGTMKSLIVSVFWPAWEWGPKGLAHKRYLTSSYEEALALRDNTRMRRLIESEWYAALWGDRVVLAKDQNAKGKFENTAMGGREARAFNSMTGGRGDVVIIDDPHSVNQAESDTVRSATVTTFREAIPSRVNNDESAIVVIMQRLHEADVSGVILAQQLGYEHLCLPMEFEPDARCRTSIGFEDPRTIPGEILLPERFPRASLDLLKRTLGSYAYAGQYQQRPAPRDGGLFKRSWFEIVAAVPAGSQRVRKWDLAGTEGDGDWTVGVLMARDVAGFVYVEDVIRFRGSPAEVERTIKNTALMDRDRYGLVRIGLSQDPGQAGKAQVGYLTRALIGFTVEAERETGSKEVRAAPFAAQAEAGNVRIVSGPWNEAFIAELTTFPTGSNDDQVDAASGAFGMLATANIATWAQLAE